MSNSIPHVNEVFCDEKALTAAETSYSDVINTGAADLGRGTQVRVDFMVHTAFTAASGSPTLTTTLQESADNSSWTDTAFSTGALAKAALPKGRLFQWSLPRTVKKFIRFKFVVATGFDTGKVSSWLSKPF